MSKLLELAERDPMPMITLWQPWASLCFVIEPAWRKGLETRGYAYPAKYEGERIALHAALGNAPAEMITDELDQLATNAFGRDWRRTLPRGAVVGTVRLGGCGPSCDFEHSLGNADRVAGIWGNGRFGWRLEEPRPLAAPVAAKGKQGWSSISLAALSLPTQGGDHGE
jgi:hypothetical protein